MKIENPAAYSFILQDDIYLLGKDKNAYTADAPPAALPEPVLKTPKANFNYLGHNKKKFLITVNYPGTEFMEVAHLAALESTLKRLSFEMDDVAIVNLAGHPEVTSGELEDFFAPTMLLVLGKSALPRELDSLPFNKPTKHKQLDALLTYSFDEMMNSTENKKAFWEQIKQL